MTATAPLADEYERDRHEDLAGRGDRAADRDPPAERWSRHAGHSPEDDERPDADDDRPPADPPDRPDACSIAQQPVGDEQQREERERTRSAASQRSAHCARFGTSSVGTRDHRGGRCGERGGELRVARGRGAHRLGATSSGSRVIGPAAPFTTCACTGRARRRTLRRTPADRSCVRHRREHVGCHRGAGGGGVTMRPRDPLAIALRPATRRARPSRCGAAVPGRVRSPGRAQSTNAAASPGRARWSAPSRGRRGCAHSFIGAGRPKFSRRREVCGAAEADGGRGWTPTWAQPSDLERRCPRGEPADRAGRPAALLPGAPLS